MNNENMETGRQPLLVELQNYERQGISIWLEGRRSCSEQVTDAVYVREDISYMRDYVFRGGHLYEIRFDKIDLE